MVRLRLVGLGIMYSNNRAEDGGADGWRRGVGDRGIVLLCLPYLVAEGI